MKIIKPLRMCTEAERVYDDILTVMQKHGISTWPRRKQAEALDKALRRAYPAKLDDIELKLRGVMSEIEKIKGTRNEVAQ